MPLSDTKIRSAKSRAKPYKLYDSGGLFIIVSPGGGRLWRFKYEFNGKAQQLSLGRYPDVGLKEARDKRDEARKLLAAGKSPGAERKREAVIAQIAAANTFKAVADELIAKHEAEGRASATMTKARWFLGHLEPALGDRPISEIEAYEVLAVVKKLESAGHHETANRTLAFASRVFRYAVATTRARTNPAADLKGALVTPKVKHHAAIIEPVGLGALLRAIDGFQGQPCTQLALRLAPHVFVRPGELRTAEWKEFDFDKEVWIIPRAKTKMRSEHVVPLSRQALMILDETRVLTGRGRYLFPGVRTPLRPLSENTLNAALRRLGYSEDEMTAHGFRSTASTLLNESGKWSPDAIERALAHKGEGVRGVYNRSPYWHERVEMAQWWSDYLDTLRQGATIIPLRFDGNADRRRVEK
jgi:integrase